MVRLREFSILIFHKLLKKATSRKKKLARKFETFNLLSVYVYNIINHSRLFLVHSSCFGDFQYHQTYHCGFYSVKGKYTYGRK